MKIHKFLILFCMAVSIFYIPVCAENVDNSTKGTMALTVQNDTPIITYDVAYTVSDDNMNILYTVNNGESTPKTVTLIAALYKDGALYQIFPKTLEVNSRDESSDTIEVSFPNNDKELYNVKMMVWENMRTLRPLGETKSVKDIEPYLREKTILITKGNGEIFKLYMNSENAIGNNFDTEHIITFNPQKFEIVDLCGLTYEKELEAGTISNTGITIQSADIENGKFVLKFTSPGKRNTGVNNVVVFKALSDVSGEEITYKIQ